jgi:2-keto-3-deoxy-L-rhamnonate aldolase RhmA
MAKYPPLGTRSASSGLPQLHYRNVPAAASNVVLNAETTVVIMVETKEALRDIDAIAAVEGVDVLLVGTNDLTAELGVPSEYGHDLIREAYRAVIAACQKHGKIAGSAGIVGRPDLLADFVQAGVRFISVGTDLSLIRDALTAKAQAVAALRP